MGGVTGISYSVAKPYVSLDHLYLFISSLIFLLIGIFFYQMLAMIKLPRSLWFKFITVQIAFHYILASMIISI